MVIGQGKHRFLGDLKITVLSLKTVSGVCCYRNKNAIHNHHIHVIRAFVIFSIHHVGITKIKLLSQLPSHIRQVKI